MRNTVNQNGNSVRSPREIDFVVTSGGKKTYIQSAYAISNEEKMEAELRPFALTAETAGVEIDFCCKT